MSKTITYPAGITSFDPMPYGYQRWNGGVWPNIQVDAYNRQLARIKVYWLAAFNVAAQREIDGLYNLANGFDSAAKAAVV